MRGTWLCAASTCDSWRGNAGGNRNLLRVGNRAIAGGYTTTRAGSAVAVVMVLRECFMHATLQTGSVQHYLTSWLTVLASCPLQEWKGPLATELLALPIADKRHALEILWPGQRIPRDSLQV